MKNLLKFLKTCFGVLGMVFLWLGCGGYEVPVDKALESGYAAMLGGQQDVRPGSLSVVFLSSGCSGVLINKYTVATVEHCLFGNNNKSSLSNTAVMQIKAGSSAQNCLTPDSDGQCGIWKLTVVRQQEADVVLLQSHQSFSNLSEETLPVVGLAPKPVQAYAHGFGVSDINATPQNTVGIRLSAKFNIVHQDDSQLYGRAAGDVRICGGDSGGPLFDDSSSAVLVGLLGATQYDAVKPSCTAKNGLNRWSRINPEFLKLHAGPCTKRGTDLDCRSGGYSTNPAATISRPIPDVIGNLRKAGVSLRPLNTVSKNELAKKQLVVLASDAGKYAVDPDEISRAVPVTSSNGSIAAVSTSAAKPVGRPTGVQGEMIPMAPRALSISGYTDNRRPLDVSEVGSVNDTYDIPWWGPACTGTLIGSRVVRTARHCMSASGNFRPWYAHRYSAGSTAWSFDGGTTFVTWFPKQVDFTVYSTGYDTNRCDEYFETNGDGISQSRINTCTRYDWALIILPEYQWLPLHNIVPTFMQLMTSNSITSVTNTGYPICGDLSINNPYRFSCIEGTLYGMFCSVLNNKTTYFWMDCDSSVGHSGGPVFVGTQNGPHWLAGNLSNGPNEAGCSGAQCRTMGTGTDAWLKNFQNQMVNQYWYITP